MTVERRLLVLEGKTSGARNDGTAMGNLETKVNDPLAGFAIDPGPFDRRRK